MPHAYATVDKLQRGWRELNKRERDTAEELLQRASRMIDAQVDVQMLSAERYECLGDIVCDMVRRAMRDATDAVGGYGSDFIEENAWESMTPVGDLWMSAENKRILGIGRGHICGLSLL